MTRSAPRHAGTPVRATERGMIGRRTLTCVQLIDIGRLPANPVYLRPGSFTAVTGVGPDDSNETSKTTFLAALTLLAGDHGWRFDSPGLGQYAAELLYNPPNSAAAAANRADHGYVVGVFVRPDGEQLLADGVTDPLTLWLRIARDSPYLEARLVEGIRLASGERQAHYIATADRIWQELPRRGTIGSGRYVEALFGGLPLSTSYVSERGGMPQRHTSLLTSQLNELTPAEIGDQLIDLGGLRPPFDQELAQRRKAAQLEARLTQRQAELATEEQRVGDQLAVMQARQDALDQVERAIELRDSYAAAAAIEAIEARRRLQAEVAAIEHGGQALRLRHELHEALEECARLQDSQVLKAAVERASGALAAAKTPHDTTKDQLRICELKLGEVRKRLAATELHRAADRHSGRSLDGIDADLSAAQAKRDEAVGQEAVTDKEHDQAGVQLRALLAGDGGPIVATLKAAGIRAIAVCDAVEPGPDRQAFWDATLQPWRDAVAIDAAGRKEAVRALHAHPGALLVLGDHNDSRPLPAGVRAAPPVVRRLLASLAARAQSADEAGVLLDGHTVVVGGFARPQVGRDARVAQAQLAVEAAAGKLAAATATRKGIEGVLATLDAERQAANAHHQREQLRSEQAQLVGLAERLRSELAPLAEALEVAGAAHRDAEVKLASHTVALQAATQLAHDKEELLRVEVEAPVRAKHAEAANQRLAHWVERLERLWRRPLVGDVPAGSALDDEPIASRTARLAVVDALDVDAKLLDRLATLARPLVREELVDARTGTLRRRYNERLDEALRNHLRIHVDEDRRGHRTVVAPGDVPEQIRAAALRRANAADAGDDERVAAFDELAEALLDVYRPMVEADQVRKDQLTRRLDKLRTEVLEADDELDAARTQAGELQGSLEELVRAFFERINLRFAEIVARDNGREADLLFRPDPPDPHASRDLPWRWHLTPRWARDDHGEKVPYTRPANLAQRKLKAVQLMLAALAADDDPSGRLLVLDELGANLGSRHRELVLRGLAEAAHRTKVTILGTVQDDLQHDAFPFCEEVLLFCYPSHSRLLNEPVQMLAPGPDGRLIPLVEALRGGRGIGWIPVLTESAGGRSTR